MNNKYLYIIIGILSIIVVVFLIGKYPQKDVQSTPDSSAITGDKSPYEDSYSDSETGLSFHHVLGTVTKKTAVASDFVFELRKGDEYNSITIYPSVPPHFNGSCFDKEHPVRVRNNTFYICDIESEAGITRMYLQKRNDSKMVIVFGETLGKNDTLLVDLGSLVVINN